MALEASDKRVSGKTKQKTRESSKTKDEERAIHELPDTVAESAQLEGENDVKRKKDKRKRTKHVMDEAPTHVDEHSEVTEHTTGEVSKKKKSKRHQDEDKLVIDAGTGVSHASPEVNTDHMSAKEKDKKDKRKKRKEDGDIGDVKESESADGGRDIERKEETEEGQGACQGEWGFGGYCGEREREKAKVERGGCIRGA